MAKKTQSTTGQRVQAEQPDNLSRKSRLESKAVLRLTVPTAEQAEARTIKIKAGS